MINTKITNTYQKVPGMLPPGEYKGVWSGYVIRIMRGTEDWEMQTANGVRGLVPCTVHVEATGNITVGDV